MQPMKTQQRPPLLDIMTSKAVRPAVSILSLARVLEILTRYHSPIVSQLDNDEDLSPCTERG
jgi:hypothetical protein